MKIGYLLIFTIFLTGCVALDVKESDSHLGSNFSKDNKPEKHPEMSTIFFYRRGELGGSVGAISIYVDDKHLININEREFIWFRLKPGIHKLKAVYGSQFKDEVLVKVDGNDYRYINYFIVTDIERSSREYKGQNSLFGDFFDTLGEITVQEMERRGLYFLSGVNSPGHNSKTTKVVGFIEEDEKTAHRNLVACRYNKGTDVNKLGY